MSGGKKKALLPERGAAWIFTVLLAVFLTAALLGSAVLQMLTSAGLHLNVASDSGMLDRQMQDIYAEIDVMAEEYGFSAEKIKASVTRDEVAEFNRKSAEWWTRLLTEGEDGAVPRWNSGAIQDIIYGSAEEMNYTEDSATIVSDLTEMIDNTVFPVRSTVVAFGTNLVQDQADVRGIVRSVRKLPLLGLVLSLACAGLIALLAAREPVRFLKYYGTAAAAAGLTVTAGILAFLLARPSEMITEASAGLAGEISTLTGKIGLAAGLAGVILLAGGYLCLFLYRRMAAGNGADAETVE